MTYVPGMAEIPGADAAASAYRCMYTDKLGSVRVVRDQNKLQKASYDYDPYGGPYQFSGLPVNHGFSGHTWDAETALYYAPYRYYSPVAARWITRDPLGMVDGLNMYEYAKQSPLLHTDPVGLEACDCGDKLAACVNREMNRHQNALNEIEKDYKGCLATAVTGCLYGCKVGCVFSTAGYLACLAACAATCSGAGAVVCRYYREKARDAEESQHQSEMKNCLLDYQSCKMDS